MKIQFALTIISDFCNMQKTTSFFADFVNVGKEYFIQNFDPLGQLIVIAGIDHYIRTYGPFVRPDFSKSSKQTEFIADQTVRLAEWVMDDFLLKIRKISKMHFTLANWIPKLRRHFSNSFLNSDPD